MKQLEKTTGVRWHGVSGLLMASLALAAPTLARAQVIEDSRMEIYGFV